MAAFKIALGLCLWLSSVTVQAAFLPSPNVRWTYELPGATPRRLGPGNNVVASSDGSRVFSTTSDGSLHILYTSALFASKVFEPETELGDVLTCRSGVTLVENEAGNVEYAVYAVLDEVTVADIFAEASDAPLTSPSSRLLAVNVDATLRWSLRLPGTVVGNPILGGDGNTFYIVHNIASTLELTETLAEDVGRVSVVVLEPEGPIITATLPETPDNAPFAPASGRTIPGQGPGGSPTDVVVFGENRENGLSEDGALFMFVPSAEFNRLGGRGNAAYDLRVASAFPRSAVARPAISQSGAEVFLAQQESTITGWNDNRELSGVIAGTEEDLFPAWLNRPRPSLQNDILPFPSAPILSADEQLLYISGASATIFCVSALTGNFIWTVETGGIHRTEPVLSEIEGEDSVVYFIQSSNGSVTQYDAESGDVNWQLDCAEAGTCGSFVEADFSVSPNGNVIYYGDTGGKIVALEVATFETVAPTQFPSMSPSLAPSAAPVVTEPPSSAPSSGPSTFVDVDAVAPSSGNESPTALTPTAPTPTASTPTAPTPTTPTASTSTAPTPTAPTGSDTNNAGVNGGEESPKGDDSNDTLPIILGAVCGGIAVLVAISFFVMKRQRKSSLEDSKLPVGDVEKGISPEDEEQKNILQLLADGTPSTPAMLPNKKKRRISSAKRAQLSTPETLGSIEESESPRVFPIERPPPDPRTLPAPRPPPAPSVDDDDLSDEVGFEVALKDRKEYDKNQKPAKNLMNAFADAEKQGPWAQALAAAAAASTAALLIDASDENESVDDTSTEDDDDTEGPEEASATSQADNKAVVDPTLRPDSPTPTMLSTDESLYIEGSTVASPMEGSDQKSVGKAESAEVQYGSRNQLDDESEAESQPGALTPRRSRTYDTPATYKKPEKGDVTISRSSSGGKSTITGASVRPRRQSSEYSRSRDSLEARKNLPQAEDLSSKRAVQPHAEYVPTASFVQQQIARYSDDSPETSPKEISQETTSKTSPNEGSDQKSQGAPEKDDAWNSFLSELSKAEEQFFNPSLPPSGRHHASNRATSPTPPPPARSPP